MIINRIVQILTGTGVLGISVLFPLSSLAAELKGSASIFGSLINIENVNINFCSSSAVNCNNSKLKQTVEGDAENFTYILQGETWSSYPTGDNSIKITDLVFGTETNNYWRFNLTLNVSEQDGENPQPSDYERWIINGSLKHLFPAHPEDENAGPTLTYAINFNTNAVKKEIPEQGDTTKKKILLDNNISGDHPGTGKHKDIIIANKTFLNAQSIEHVDDPFDDTAEITNWEIRVTAKHQVPEPTTILGTATALGCGALLKRKHSKKRNKS